MTTSTSGHDRLYFRPCPPLPQAVTASTSGLVRLNVRPCPPQRQAVVLDDPRGVKGNIRLFRPIHLHLLLDDPRGVKGKTVVSFSATKGVFVFWTARFFSHSLPHTSVNLLISFTFPLPSPHLLRISFIISFNLFAYLSDCYPCFEGDEEIFWENKHFIDQRAQRAHRPMGRMGRMGRHFFNTSRTRAQELLFSIILDAKLEFTHAHTGTFEKSPPHPPHPTPSGRWCDTICRV